ncbi:MAG: hypothetical protein KBA26_06105 [Candidatus Delongbacteria bacterium]|nr:hypothetical protein [Candidatus Delongbacteria bacterium]
MNSILNNLPDKSREIIQSFLMSFKNKIAEDLVNYQKVTEEIKKTAQKGIETRLQLHQIDKETEKAATGIIEKSEIIMERQNMITDIAKRLKTNFQTEEETLIPKFESLLLNILEISRGAKSSNLDKGILGKIKATERDLIIMTADKLVNQESLTDIIKQLDVNANDNVDDLFEILNLCQFQDITSQELAKAHSLIKTIVERLNYVLMAFNIEGLDVKDDIKIKAFDSNATYSDRTHEQHEVDMMFQNQQQTVKSEAAATPGTAKPSASPKASAAKPEPPKAAPTPPPQAPAAKVQTKPAVPAPAPKKVAPAPPIPKPEDLIMESDESGDDIFEQLQKELQLNSSSAPADTDQLMEDQDEIMEEFQELNEEIALDENQSEEIGEETVQPDTAGGDTEIDIDELAKKFESAGSGEIISQEEIDRILSGG